MTHAETNAPKGLPPTMVWEGAADGYLRLLDQTKLPTEVVWRDCHTKEDVWDAIKVLAVRGAPAIGVAAAYGVCLGARPCQNKASEEFLACVREVGDYLNSSRPTAVNLSWAVRRMIDKAQTCGVKEAGGIWRAMFEEAKEIHREDAERCRKIGEHGASLIPDGGAVLTHCNAGALATSAYGTALSPMYVAHEQGCRFAVFADETRPLLQGARLTAFELASAGIDVTVICDGVSPSLMRQGKIQLVIVGADRIAANGDTANKIGTYSVAVAAKHHGIPFYVAAPTSTFDLDLSTGDEIPIETRDDEEIRCGFGKITAAPAAKCLNPAFDVTPAALITGIITERGILSPIAVGGIAEMVG